MTPPEKTGIKSVDEKNYNDYLKILQIYRPDFFAEEENKVDVITPKAEQIIEIDDVVPSEPWLTPKTEEIDGIEPTVKPIPVIPQEIVKLPHPIPKTGLPENIDYISAISDIIRINNEKFRSTDDDDIDFNIVQQISDSEDDDTIYVKYIPPPAEVPVQPPIYPRE